MLGKGTPTTAPILQIGTGPAICVTVPVAEGGEGVIAALRSGLGEHNTAILDAIGDPIADLEVQGRAHRLGRGCLGLGREFAGNHAGASFTIKIKGIVPDTYPYHYPLLKKLIETTQRHVAIQS